MKSQKVNERDPAVLECDLNDKDGDVEWFHDGVKIKIDNKRYREERINRKRRLFIDVCLLEEQGEYMCKTKDDTTMAQLIVDGLL